jgi:hypothetical protein
MGEWTLHEEEPRREETHHPHEGDGTSHLKPTHVSVLHEAEAGGEDRIPTKEEIGEGGGGVRGAGSWYRHSASGAPERSG